MYLHVITRQEVEELRHYETLKSGKESHAYTMSSNEKSFIVRGVYISKLDAEKDLDIMKKADHAYRNPSHKFVNYTTAGRKIYEHQCIRYSIKGNQYNTYYVAVKDGKIIAIAPQRHKLENPDGAEVSQVVKIGGRYYKINEGPVYAKADETTGENE